MLLLPLLFASTVLAQFQLGQEFDVYFLAGQSNATGRGDSAELPNLDGGLYSNPQTDVAFYYHQTLTNGAGQINTAIPEDLFLPLQAGSGHGFNNPSSHPSEFGPELSLGRALADADPSRNIAIIKYGHGGSNLHTQWAAGGEFYTEFLGVVDDSLDDITNAGGSFNLKGFAWVQGESDTGNANSLAYTANLTDLVSRVRSDVFGGQSAPVVVTQLSANQYNNLGSGQINVRNAQATVAANDPFVFVTSSDGPEFSTYNISTPIHFDARGNISQGLAIADKFINGDSAAPDPPFVGSTVYEISSTTRFGDNGANPGGGVPTFTENLDGSFTLANDPTSGANNAVYIESGPSNINTLATSALGRPVLPTDTVVVSGTIDSSNINPNANGFEFGIQSATGFRSDPNLLFQIDNDGERGGRAPFFGTPSPGDNQNRTEVPGADEASLVDGFSFRATYDANEITWEVTDIFTVNEQDDEPVGATSYSFTFTDDDYQNNFTTLVGGGFSYFSSQKTGAANETVISSFQIEVVEPGTGTLMCDFNGDGDCDPEDLDELYRMENPDISAWLSQAENPDNLWKTDTARNPDGASTDLYELGDANLDGDVNSTDLGLLLNNFNNADGLPPAGVGFGGGDLDADGIVDSTDLGLLLNNFNFTSAAAVSAVPEPGTLGLFAYSLLGLLGLRRRSR